MNLLDSKDDESVIEACEIIESLVKDNKPLQKVAGDSEAVEKLTTLLQKQKLQSVDVDMVSDESKPPILAGVDLLNS